MIHEKDIIGIDMAILNERIEELEIKIKMLITIIIMIVIALAATAITMAFIYSDVIALKSLVIDSGC